jgi:FixJ family two-component response regulator
MRPAGPYFTFLFDPPPYDGGSCVNPETPKRTQPTGDEPIVYIVDDDVSVRESLRLLFRSVNLCAELFDSASALLQRKLPSVPSCLVLDVRLPGLSGFELHSELTKANIHIPIIFMTAHGDIPMSVRAMKSGAIDFITKPFRDQDMLEAVTAAINRDRDRLGVERARLNLQKRFDNLTLREQQVMALVTTGLMNKQIAAKMGLSEITVKIHRMHVMKKMQAKSLANLVKMAEALGTSKTPPTP